MKSKFFTAVAASLLLAVSSFAADNVSGKWSAEMQGPQGNTMTQTFTLKAEGEKLTGTVSGRGGDTPISDGTVKGDEVSFNVVRKMQDGNEIKIGYKGKVAGDELKLTRAAMGDRPA